MPLHLTPFSRREFLRRSVLAGAGLLTIPALRAATGADPNRWALLSDTHVAGDPATIMREVNMAAHLRNVVTQVQTLSAPPAGLLVNGDCAVTSGLAADYATFTDLLQPLTAARLPLHFLLGNHDDRDVFWSALKDAKSPAPPVASKHLAILETPVANWFLLDSLDQVNKTPGLLGDEQRAWLGKALDSRADKPALVMVHHNPISADAAKKSGLVDAPEFLEIVLPRRHVKAVFYGHTHTWRQLQQDGLHLINLPAVAYPFKPEELTGWVDCTLRADGATLDPRAHNTARADHGKVVNLTWR